MALEESNKASEDDAVTDVDGIHFLVAENQSYYFNDVKLDYTKNWFNMGEYKLLTV